MGAGGIMAAFNFDATELASFFVAIFGFAIICYLYFFKKKKPSKLEKGAARMLLLIFLFIFLNRLFTNAEAIAYKPFFNMLEHLSSLAAGVIAVMLSWSGIKGDKNRK